MVGRYIRFTKSASANGGDGYWYPISAVGSTTGLTLDRAYLGTAISAASAAYTIGDVMVIPERYQLGPVYYAASQYWYKAKDFSQGDRFLSMYEKLADQMRSDLGKKTTDFSLDDGSSYMAPNPNAYIYNITP
jgi:hypothetical protein